MLIKEIKQTNSLRVFLISFAVALTGMLLFGASPVSALLGDPSSSIPNNGIDEADDASLTPWLIVTRPGSNGMDSPDQQVFAYFPVPAGGGATSFRLYINNACDFTSQDDRHPSSTNSTYYEVYSSSGVSDLVNASIVYENSTFVSVSCDGVGGTANSFLTVGVSPSTTPIITLLDGGVSRGYYRVILRARTASPESTYYANRFRYTSPTSGTRFGFRSSSTNPGGDTTRYTGIAFTNRPDAWSWRTSIGFAQPCNEGTTSARIWFYDTDHNPNNENTDPEWQTPNHTMNWTLSWFDRDTNLYIGTTGGVLTGGQNESDSTPLINFNSNYQYRLTITGINYVNSIQVALPFEQIYALADCVDPPPGDRPPAISAVPVCRVPSSASAVLANARGIAITTTDFDHSGRSNYTIERRVRTHSGGAWGDWSNWATISHTAYNVAVTDYQRFYELGAGNDFSTMRFQFRTRGTAPAGAPTPAWVNSAVVNYGPCVRSTCTITPPATIYWNEPNNFTVRVNNTGTNNGRSWTTSENYQLRQTGPGATTIAARLDSGAAVGVGGSRVFTVSVTPTTVGTNTTYTWRMSRGATLFGTACSFTGRAAYRPPTVSCVVTPPSPIEANTEGDVDLVARYSGPANSAPNGQVTAGRLTGSGTTRNSPTSPTLPVGVPRGVAGRTLNFDDFPIGGAGTVNWAGQVTIEAPNGIGGTYTRNANCSSSSVAGNYSYFKEFGGDVWTGGNFENIDASCEAPSDSPGRALGFAEPTGPAVNGGRPYRGTSTQLTLTSLMNVNQVFSASSRNMTRQVDIEQGGTTSTILGRTYAPKGLTFANYGTGQPNSTFGGGFGANADRCITDFFNDTQDATLTQTGDFPPTTTDALDIRDTPRNVTVPTNSSVGTNVSVFPYNAATHPHDYVIEVTGTFTFTPGPFWVADAFCTGVTFPTTDWRRTHDSPDEHIPELLINGSTVSWNAVGPGYGTDANCSQSHTYRTTVRPTTGNLNLRVNDPGNWGDNIGSLDVTVTPTPTPVPDVVQGDFPAGRLQYHIASETISELEIPIGTQVAVYAAGNVHINGNITTEAGATSVADLPNFALIVCGSIYINSNVTRIDGLLVAQPGRPVTHSDGSVTCEHDGTVPANSGTIYTCASGLNVACTAANLYARSNNRQLSINGSLVANRIKFLRARGSLRDGGFGEVPDFANGQGTGAAEVVNFTPQMYLAPSALRTPGMPEGNEDGTGLTGTYDAIRGLPPIF